MKIKDEVDWELHFTRFRSPLVQSIIQGGWCRYEIPVQNLFLNAKVYFNETQYEACVRWFQKKADFQYLLEIPKSSYIKFEEKKPELLALESRDLSQSSDK